MAERDNSCEQPNTQPIVTTEDYLCNGDVTTTIQGLAGSDQFQSCDDLRGNSRCEQRKADTQVRMPAPVGSQNFSYGVISHTTPQPQDSQSLNPPPLVVP